VESVRLACLYGSLITDVSIVLIYGLEKIKKKFNKGRK